MACNSSGSGCQSGCCHKSDDERPPPPTEQNPDPDSGIVKGGGGEAEMCVKCKINPPAPIETIGGGAFCGECFRGNVYGKFRIAVTSHAMITPSDNVLVAFSGGTSSRVALEFVHEMQQKKQNNFDASKDRALRVFGVAVSFIDETSVYPDFCDKFEEAIRDMRLIVSSLAPPTKQFHVVPIDSVYASDSGDGKEKLAKLLGAVDDETGKEDLLLHLRMLALQKVAVENGYTRIVLGTCTSRIARHVIATTVKGQGYSLSADIQYADARWEVPVVLPLRDCTAQELNSICILDRLKTVQLLNSPSSSINSLVFSFVTTLQEENPSRESTIVRTAGKLTPFLFNRIPVINDSNVPLATIRRQKRYSINPNESISSESFCPICNSPLNSFDLFGENGSSSSFDASCCSSCRFQILPKDPLSREHFYSLLPQPLVARASHGSHGDFSYLREQIQDCLLSDSEGET